MAAEEPETAASNRSWRGYGVVVAVRTDGTLWAWGANGYGQLGDGTAGGVRTTPEQIGTATNWTSLPRIGSSDDSLALASA